MSEPSPTYVTDGPLPELDTDRPIEPPMWMRAPITQAEWIALTRDNKQLKTMNSALENECARLQKALAWISPKDELPPDCSTVEFAFYRFFGALEYGHGYVTTNPPLDPVWHLVADGHMVDLKPYQHVEAWRPV